MLSQAIETDSRCLSTSLEYSTGDTSTSSTLQKVPKCVPCMDVVIPTYRCDPSMLCALTSLGSSDVVSLNTLVIVDRSDAPTLDEIKVLESYEVDRVVRFLSLSCVWTNLFTCLVVVVVGGARAVAQL